MGTRILGTELSGTKISNAEPWTVERKLHLLLAGVVVLGWVVAYTALTRGVDGSQDIARSEGGGMKVSVNLTP